MLDHALEFFGRKTGEVRLAWQGSAHAADGVLDAALLPRRVRVAEVGIELAPALQHVMLGELVPLSRLKERRRTFGTLRKREMRLSRTVAAGLVGQELERDEARGALMGAEQIVAVSGVGHEVGLPVAGVLRSSAWADLSLKAMRFLMKLAEEPPRLPKRPRRLLALGSRLILAPAGRRSVPATVPSQGVA